LDRAVRYPRDGHEFNRAIAFFDATFAVALTLLATTLDIHDQPKAFTSVSALDDAVGAQFVAFAISFVVIASYWLANHRLVADFSALDMPTIVAHLVLVAAVVLLPFSTAAVGDPGVADLALPTVLMAVTVAAVSAFHTLVWVVAARGGLIDPKPTRDQWLETVLNSAAPAAVFLVSIPIAYLVSPGAARLSWLLLIVVNPVIGEVLVLSRRRRRRGD
jgi:uncharacterized membrane protein